MPGFGNRPDAAPTKDWTLKVTLDEHLPTVQSRLFVVERKGDQFGLKPQAETENVVYIPEVGWQLRPHILKPGGAFEVNDGQSDILSVTGGTLALAAEHEEVNLFKTESLLGVSYADSPSSGGTFFQKRIGDSVSFTQNLSSDETTLPKPNTAEDNVVMDRVAKSTSDHRPGDHISLAFYVPGFSGEETTTLVTSYFNGGAGVWNNWTGLGQYALKLMGNKKAKLYERGRVTGEGSDSWNLVSEFKWADSQVYNAHHKIVICTDAYQDGGDWYGRGMAFVTQTLPEPGRNSNPVEALVSQAIFVAGEKANTPTYAPRQDTLEPITPAPIRIDTRRNVRPLVQIAKSSYPETGYIIDGIISLPMPPAPDDILQIRWIGDAPSDTAVTIRLLDAETGTELTGRTATDYDRGGIVTYPAPVASVPQRHFRIKAELAASTDLSRTPTIKTVIFIRSAVIADPGITPVELTERTAAGALPIEFLSNISVQQPARQASGQTAAFRIADLGGGLTRLENRASIPVKIEIERPALDPVVLFRGHIEEAERAQVAPNQGGSAYPAYGGRIYSCPAAGMWRQVQEQLTPTHYAWLDAEQSPSLPMKITDIARELLTNCFDPAYVDVPDVAVRLWGKEAGVVLPAGTEVLSYLEDLLDGYLGAYLLWDDAAGTDGMMRVLESKVPPYTPIAAFSLQNPSSGKLSTAPQSYATVTHAPSGAVLRPVYIRKGSYSQKTLKAEGTSVTVIGMSDADGGGQITQCAFNVNAYDPYGSGTPDPEHPAYVGREVPIQYYDKGLIGQDAVDWMTKRIFEVSCVPRRQHTFQAPSQLVTDSTDALQVRPRPLRFYDPVLLIEEDGTQRLCLVMSNTVSGQKAWNMTDSITMIAVDTSYVGSQYQGGMPRLREPIETSRRVISRMIGYPQFLPQFVLAKGRAQVDALGIAPGQILDPIMDFNPASPTYGQWL